MSRPTWTSWLCPWYSCSGLTIPLRPSSVHCRRRKRHNGQISQNQSEGHILCVCNRCWISGGQPKASHVRTITLIDRQYTVYIQGQFHPQAFMVWLWLKKLLWKQLHLVKMIGPNSSTQKLWSLYDEACMLKHLGVSHSHQHVQLISCSYGKRTTEASAKCSQFCVCVN